MFLYLYMYCFYYILKKILYNNSKNNLNDNNSLSDENKYQEFKDNIFDDILPTYNEAVKYN